MLSLLSLCQQYSLPSTHFFPLSSSHRELRSRVFFRLHCANAFDSIEKKNMIKTILQAVKKSIECISTICTLKLWHVLVGWPVFSLLSVAYSSSFVSHSVWQWMCWQLLPIDNFDGLAKTFAKHCFSARSSAKNFQTVLSLLFCFVFDHLHWLNETKHQFHRFINVGLLWIEVIGDENLKGKKTITT